MGGRVMSTITATGAGYYFDRHVYWRSWREDAACGSALFPRDGVQQLDRDAAEGFFPTGVTDRATEAAAKRVCDACPVRAVCLADALLSRHANESGVRGGMTTTERHDLTAEQREALIAPHLPPEPEVEED